jgi:hypothetical protein
MVKKTESDDDFDFRNVDDACITELLASPNPDCRKLGLFFLHQMKAEGFCAYLKQESETEEWRLSWGDIAKIWGATEKSIRSMVRAGKFKREGSLNGLIGQTIRWRTSDFLRARRGINVDVEVEAFECRTDGDEVRIDEAHETREEMFQRQVIDKIHVLPMEDLLQNVNRIAERPLAYKETLFMRHYLCFYKKYGSAPSDEEVWESVTEEQSERAKTGVTKWSMKAAKARAFKKIRGQGELS